VQHLNIERTREAADIIFKSLVYDSSGNQTWPTSFAGERSNH